jgi:putative membrane protein insertion efficiency factor
MTLHELVHRAGAPARAVLLAAIRVYSVVLSGWLGGQCRFVPTCSRYAEVAIRRHGAVRGSMMALWRLARCNPWGRGGSDPVPSSRDHRDDAYDVAIQRGEARA